MMKGIYVGALAIAIFVLPAMVSYYLAGKKERPAFVWVVLALFFSWPVVLAMLLFVKDSKMVNSGCSKETESGI